MTVNDSHSITPPEPKLLLVGLRQTLDGQGVPFDDLVREFGQVPASEARERGHDFGLRDHVRALVLSQLSNQRPWGPIAANLAQIEALFYGFDPTKLERTDPEKLRSGLAALRCGNRSIEKQLEGLATNIATFRGIERTFGSVDDFVTSAQPDVIAKRLSQPGKYKLRQIGYTLALEYLRNVGIRAGKPDLHVRRALSGERLGYASGYPSEEEAYSLIGRLAEGAECNPIYIDNLLWLFCAQDYGNVCRARPRCDVCALAEVCNYPRRPNSSEGRGTEADRA